MEGKLPKKLHKKKLSFVLRTTGMGTVSTESTVYTVVGFPKTTDAPNPTEDFFFPLKNTQLTSYQLSVISNCHGQACKPKPYDPKCSQRGSSQYDEIQLTSLAIWASHSGPL